MKSTDDPPKKETIYAIIKICIEDSFPERGTETILKTFKNHLDAEKGITDQMRLFIETKILEHVAIACAVVTEEDFLFKGEKMIGIKDMFKNDKRALVELFQIFCRGERVAETVKFEIREFILE